MNTINFTKMHGLGNDFVIIDNRSQIFIKNSGMIKKICNRKEGIGCDQLILIEECQDKLADVRISIFNSDGSEVETCGNATRCVGKIILEEKKTKNILVETIGGLLDVEKLQENFFSVDMGVVKVDWRDIPLSSPKNIADVGIDLPILKGGFVVNIGNPHIVFFTEEKNMNMDTISSDCNKISKMSLFPKGININIAQVLTKKTIKLLIYERGVGFTNACGSGACATLAAAFKLGYTDRDATIKMPGGELDIEYMNDNHILMSGPVSKSYCGFFEMNFYNNEK